MYESCVKYFIRFYKTMYILDMDNYDNIIKMKTNLTSYIVVPLFELKNIKYLCDGGHS